MMRLSPTLAALGLALAGLLSGSALAVHAAHGTGDVPRGSTGHLAAAGVLSSDHEADDSDDLTPDDAPAHDVVRVASVEPALTARPEATPDVPLPVSVIQSALPTRGPPR